MIDNRAVPSRHFALAAQSQARRAFPPIPQISGGGAMSARRLPLLLLALCLGPRR